MKGEWKVSKNDTDSMQESKYILGTETQFCYGPELHKS